MNSSFRFEVLAQDPSSRARAGLLHTPHGVIETPIFMPVGTAGSVKGITQDSLEDLGVQILLGNTYHLYLRPGHELIREMGGLHRFMSWNLPILTDSGGFQVMSLKGLSRLTEDGVWFQSHLDGSSHFLSPEKSMEIQLALGADIIMAFDECVRYPASRETVLRATKLSGRWARRSKDSYLQMLGSQGNPSGQSPNVPMETGIAATKAPATHVPTLFGIVQGGMELDLRKESAEEITDLGFEGYALGGLSVGESKTETYDVAEFTANLLPQDMPRYLMGVGTPEDLAECVARGIDMFDCVMPTRNARNGCAFTSEGKLSLRNSRYAKDVRPLDAACGCSVCRRYSRAYIRHLFVAGEMLAGMLVTHHNLYFYLDTMRKIRQAILSGEFGKIQSRVRARP